MRYFEKTIKKRKHKFPAALICAITLFLPLTDALSDEVNLETLIQHIGDRESLTRFGHHDNYRLLQASSDDKRNNTELSTRLGKPWGYANVDYGNFIRKEVNAGRNEWVLFEQQGPGAITRWWSTAVREDLTKSNHFRIYIDGNTEPALTRTLSELTEFDTLGFGDGLNFETPNAGGNLYGPVAYQNGVKVTWDGPANHDVYANVRESVAAGNDYHERPNAIWYNINYRQYEPGTKVESFSAQAIKPHKAALKVVNQRLLEPDLTEEISQTDLLSAYSLGSGDTLTRTFKADGNRNGKAIREISLRVNNKNDAEIAAALKGVMIEIIFDSQKTVRVPVGHFFGNGSSENAGNPYNDFSDYFRQVKNGDMRSWWVMPFQNDAQFRLINNSDKTLNLDLAIKLGAYEWTDDAMHFHGDYRSEANIRTRDTGIIRHGGQRKGTIRGRPSENNGESANGSGHFRFVDIRGTGLYVGDTLSVRNRSIGITQTQDTWWGEGDEKIYVDYLDENGNGSAALPVQVGTGTEDYYGYSWASNRLFGSPFVNQPIASAQFDPSGKGLTVNSRIRVLDTIPFDQSMKFDMEVWKWKQGAVDMDVGTFWYGLPGSASMRVVSDLADDITGFRKSAQRGKVGSRVKGEEGTWSFYAAEKGQRKGRALSWGDLGNAGNVGFGGGQGGLNLPAVSDAFILRDGYKNIGIQNAPGYHEVAIHPPHKAKSDLVIRWQPERTATGLVNVHGSIRNLISAKGEAGSDSIHFSIFVKDKLVYELDAEDLTGDVLEQRIFDFDATVAAGDSIFFVIGNGASGDNYHADESLLRATIMAIGAQRHSVKKVSKNEAGQAQSFKSASRTQRLFGWQ